MSPSPPCLVRLPSGFGEIAMIWMKLGSVPSLPVYEDLEYHVELCADRPRGCEEYTTFLPYVTQVTPGPHTTTELLRRALPPEACLQDVLPGPLYPTVDAWTLSGRPISDWLPEIPCAYHYPLTLPASARDTTAQALGEHPFLLVYPSSLDRLHMEDGWGAVWGVDEWVTLCRHLEHRSALPVFLLGSRDDASMLNQILARTGWSPRRVLKTQRLADALAILARATYFIGFPAGPAVVASVLGVPHCTLFRGTVQRLHRGTWTDPEMLLDGSAYLPFFEDGPQEVARGILSRLQHLARQGRLPMVHYVPDQTLVNEKRYCPLPTPPYLEGDLQGLFGTFQVVELGILAEPDLRDCVSRGIPADEHYSWLYALGRHFRPQQLLEIGSGYGHGASSILAGVLDAGVPPVQVGLVDVRHLNYAAYVVKKTCGRSSYPVEVRLSSGTDVVAELGLSAYDLVHVDASRDSDSCLDEYRRAWALVGAPGTLVVTGVQAPGPGAAFAHLCRELGVPCVTLPTCCGLGILRKGKL
jgi:hypothetical protein